MLKRQRDIQRMVADLGLEVTSFRTDGGTHWRVDVRAPNGRQRPFTFPTNETPRGPHNERAMLRRWRNDVMPELDDAEAQGKLETPETMLSPLGHKLKHAVRELKGTEIVGGSPGSIPPFEKSLFPVASVASDANKERSTVTIQASPSPASAPIPTPAPSAAPESPVAEGEAKKRRLKFLTAAQSIKLADWVRTPGLLDEPFTQAQFAAKASKELGFAVTESHARTTLEALGLALKKPGHRGSGNMPSHYRTRTQIIAEALVAVMERLQIDVPLDLMAVALGERELRKPDQQQASSTH